MSITNKQKRDLNRMNVAGQKVLIGDIINNLNGMANQSASAVNITGGSLSGVSVSATSIISTSVSASTIVSTTISASSISANTISGSFLTLVATSSSPLLNVVSGSGIAARFGDGTNYTSFEADGTMTFTGSATVWDDIFFPLVTAKQGQTDKPAFDSNEVAYLFPQNDTTEFMYIVAQLPHSMKVGSDLSPHVHWKQTQSGSPIFKMDYKWFPISGSVPTVWQTHTMGTPAIIYTSGSMHQLTYGNKISGSILQTTSVGVSSIMLIKFYRDTGDGYAGNAVVYQFDIHYQRDSLGSRQEFIK